MTLNAYRNKDLEGQQKTFLFLFFYNCVVAPRGLGCDVLFFISNVASRETTTTLFL
jgi:hypothetical protein